MVHLCSLSDIEVNVRVDLFIIFSFRTNAVCPAKFHWPCAR